MILQLLPEQHTTKTQSFNIEKINYLPVLITIIIQN